MSYFVYILKSEKNGSFYKGMTNNIERRLKEHNDLKVKYSRAHAPWKLVLTIEKEGKTEALQLERKLKNLSRDRLVMFIKKYA